MRNCMLATAVILIHLAIGLGTNAARSEEVREDSLEWLVADSDLIVRGTIRAVRTEDRFQGEATIAVKETFKGKQQDEWTFATRVLGWPADLGDKREPVLAFIKGGDLKQVLSLAEVAKEDRKSVWHASSFRRSAVTMDCRVLWAGDDKLHAVREAVEFGADLPAPKPTIIVVGPFGPSDEAFWLLWSGSGVSLTVPLDSRSEATARTWARHEYEHVRSCQGEALLRRLQEAKTGAGGGLPREQAAGSDKDDRANAPPPLAPKPMEPVIHEATPPFGEEILAPVASRQRPAEEKGLVLEVEFDRREYLLGEPLLVRCSLANYSRAPITIVFGRWEPQGTIEFELGKRIARWPSERDTLGPRPRTIPAGWRLVESYNLLDEYQITEAGEYTATVKYESDGRWARGEGHWNGKLAHSLGAITIVEPTRPEDKAALEWLMGNDPIGRRANSAHLFYADDNQLRFGKFLEQHGTSRYAAYARYGDGMGVLHYAKRVSPATLSKPAIEILGGIDPKGFPPLIAERRLFHLIEAHKLVGSKPDEIKGLVEEFVRQYSDSPLVSFVKGERP